LLQRSALEEKVFQFFDKEIDPARPVLLGISGGPDSVCLLHLLLKYSKTTHLVLHLAHVDHGWRQESADEAETIEKLASSLGLPFHTIRLAPKEYTGNLEAESRDDRLEFFTQLAQEIGAQGIFLGHQLDDQLETVFKRFLEGVLLPYLSGMRPVTQIGTLTIFRPLLSVSKKEVLEWLGAQKISYLEDPTNKDIKFLRAKMREEMFPFLRTSFGKEFQQNVCRIAHDAQEVRAYFDEKVAPYLESPIVSDWGYLFDFTSHFPTSVLEMRELFRNLGERYHFSFNRYQVQLAISFITSNAANKYLEIGEKTLYFDRRRLFLLEKKFDPLPDPVPLQMGVQYFGPWRIDVVEWSPAFGDAAKNNWQDVWKGSCSTILPYPSQGSTYILSQGALNLRKMPQGKVLGKALTDKKVPHALYTLCPVIRMGENILEDFLLGYKPLTSEPAIYITLEKGYNLVRT
jgi:tRNA(Ile)-lysidine synthase